ncbi:hypothetical protein GCM10027566_06730 [Arachidicoccus ginsenosidivorans]|uniref:Uncharacterized protein n=1 Tax=Arachidicoccus ginsenosidivorans TaxID=496057 RepID=A0A5B8VQQ2_9BACT|nr:hypothetical protein [Arachidicoccus ginsenosidivorans]QEC73947.1 hypothetical protein FSB73_22030 [Arachidicoccus ginsenosidivorans]
MEVHIGEIIKELAKTNNKETTDIANYLSTSVSNIYSIYNRETIDVDKLKILSEYFKVNLFKYYLESEPLKAIADSEINQLKNEIAILKKQIIEKEETIKDKKNIIAFLEEKLNKMNSG